MTYSEVSPIGWTKAAISRVAGDLCAKWDITPAQSLDEIITRLGGRIEYQNVFTAQDTNDGSIVIDGIRNFTVYLPDYVSNERNRFTIAHEIGHYILHYVAQNLGDQNAKVRAARAAGPDQNKAEREADWFAAGFLMPKPDFLDVYNKNDKNILSTARHFGVSTQAARWQVEYYDANNIAGT
jgi:Zn-dependent peptidase ImmA (M78 family)